VNEIDAFCRVSKPEDAVALRKRVAELNLPLRLHLSSRRDLFESIRGELTGDPGIRDIRIRQVEHSGDAVLDLVALLRAAAQTTGVDSPLLFLDCDVSHSDGLGNAVSVAQLHDDLCDSSEVVRGILGQFAANRRLGVVVPRGFWRGLEGVQNVHLLQPHADAMRLRLDITRQGRIPGAIFWCRKSALRPFLRLSIDIAAPAASGGTARLTEGMIAALLTLGVEAAGFEIRDARGFLLHAPEEATMPWLPGYRWAPCERRWADETMAGWHGSGNPAPRLQFLVLPNPCFDRQATERSLGAQWLPVADPIHIPDGALDRVCQLFNEASAACSADWIGILRAGDTLPADATFRIELELRNHPRWQLAYTDSDILTAEHGHINPNFKPDLNIDYLRSFAYVDSILLVRASALRRLGGLDPTIGAAFDLDLMLRAWEELSAAGAPEDSIGHLPNVLIHRATATLIPQQTPPALLQDRRRAVEAHFRRLGIDARVEGGLVAGTFRVRWPLPDPLPLVSIIVTTHSESDLLRRCIESVLEKTAYPAYELLLVNCKRDDAAIQLYLGTLRQRRIDHPIQVIDDEDASDPSALINAAANRATGKFLLLLGSNVATYHENWLTELVSHGERPEVGVVGARLLHGDKTLQHAGVVLGMGGIAGRVYAGESAQELGHYCRAQVTQNYSAVDGACMLIRRDLYLDLGGLDAATFPCKHADIDLCIKARERGRLIVWTPFATLLQLDAEDAAGNETSTSAEDPASATAPEAKADAAMLLRWLPKLTRDPAFNTNLSLRNTDARVSMQSALAWSPLWRPRPRILAFRADNHAVGNYRIKRPMLNLQRAGRVQGFDTVAWSSLAEVARIEPDTLIFQRPIDADRHAQIKLLATHNDAFRIFEIDDLLTDLPHHNPARKGMPEDIASRMRDSLGLCDRLVASTAPIAEAYGGWVDGDVLVVPNYIERDVWGKLRPQRAERSKPRVGWSGGLTHMADLELLAPVFRALADEVDFVMLGICPDLLRPYVREIHVGVPIELYPQFLCDLDLDLALAPLEMHPFNEAKSHLKLLEYGALGYPVVCTDILPYQGDWPVFRVKNRPSRWIAQIRELLADRDGLLQAGDALRAHVFNLWSLEDHLDLWEHAWTPREARER
jgi:GT2 family glycosyltransferase/glycosyltransferase involved in cell wall biosynthesis